MIASDDDKMWIALEREADIRADVIREMDGRIIDLNEVERRVRERLEAT